MTSADVAHRVPVVIRQREQASTPSHFVAGHRASSPASVTATTVAAPSIQREHRTTSTSVGASHHAIPRNPPGKYSFGFPSRANTEHNIASKSSNTCIIVAISAVAIAKPAHLVNRWQRFVSSSARGTSCVSLACIFPSYVLAILVMLSCIMISDQLKLCRGGLHHVGVIVAVNSILVVHIAIVVHVICLVKTRTNQVNSV